MAEVSLKSKINEIRLALSKDMSKSGKNNFSKYEYFQLKDFIPQTLELCNEKGVYTEFWISKDKRELPTIVETKRKFDENGVLSEEIETKKEAFEYVENAHLIAINLDDEEDVIHLIKETANVNVQGAQPIQNLGGKSTYMKRYMYMDLLEINENDKIEEQTGAPTKVTTTATKSTPAKAVKTTTVKNTVEVKPSDFEPKKEPEVVTPKVEKANTAGLMEINTKMELATFMKDKGLDPRSTIVEAAKKIGRDVPLLLESDAEAIRKYVEEKLGGE